jgi:DNA-binding NarL/FixJ family response regulator
MDDQSPPTEIDGSNPSDPSGRTISLVICDDHRTLTDALATVVRLDDGLRLAGEPVHDPASAVALVSQTSPDVVLMDIVFKGDAMSGIDATRQIKEVSPTTKVLIMTAHDEDRLLVEAVEAGASGFLGKGEAAQELLSAAKAAADGDVLIDPVTLPRLLAQVSREREAQRDAQVLLDELTGREREILGLLAQGMRGDDIAAQLFISPQTVQTHVRNILAKLGVHSKLEAVAFAVKHGAIEM